MIGPFPHEYARGELRELRSGATLLQDEDFMSAGKSAKDTKIVALKPV
jgi:hypothetical protein